MSACRTLRVISKHGAGVNNIDVDAATNMAVPVFYTPGANADAVVELTFGLLLSVARTIPVHDRAIRSGQWIRSGDGMQLAGRTMGIVGLGQIGSRVARVAQAFGMKVLAVDPHVQSTSVEMVQSIDQLLPRVDVVSLHCPLTPATKGMIGARALGLLRSSAIILNTSRGPVIDEPALIDALTQRKIHGAGLDTYAAEPLTADHPLCKCPNVVLTPHVGGSTVAALDSVAEGAATTAVAFLRGEQVDPSLCVNPTALRTAKATSTQ